MVSSVMQVSDANLMVGIEGRSSLLFNLSKALEANPRFFGRDGRPGNVIGRTSHFQSDLYLNFLDRFSGTGINPRRRDQDHFYCCTVDGVDRRIELHMAFSPLAGRN